MSRAFVKEDASGPDEDPPEKPLSTLPNYCTPRGIERYRAEEERLVKELEPLAGAQDDPAKRRRKRELERDLRWVRARWQAAIPVDPAKQPKGAVRFGARVTLAGPDGTAMTVSIVGEDEAEGDRLSYASPLAELMLGLEPGGKFAWDGGTYTVVSIEYAS